MRNIRIGVVDDHRLFTQTLAKILDNEKGISTLFTASSGTDLFKKLKRYKTLPDVILMDLQMPEMNGLKASIKLKKEYPTIRIIVITMHTEESYILSLIENGVDGYLFKDTEPVDVTRAIESVYNGEKYFNQKVIQAISRGLEIKKNNNLCFNKSTLPISFRELDVLKLICEGKKAIEIADELNISKKTVDAHRNSLLAKTHSRNIIALVVYAIRNNLVEVNRYPKL